MDRQSLQKEFEGRGGTDVRRCVQCGTCGASCPLRSEMGLGPRGLFAAIRDGDIGWALGSDTLWLCVSCYECWARCPQEIPVTDLMYTLKQMAVERDLAPRSAKALDLYKSFRQVALGFGRVTEPLVMARYSAGHPGDAAANMDTGWKLFRRRRLPLWPQKSDRPKAFRDLLGRVGGRR